jgi:hypothetical protein
VSGPIAHTDDSVMRAIEILQKAVGSQSIGWLTPVPSGKSTPSTTIYSRWRD